MVTIEKLDWLGIKKSTKFYKKVQEQSAQLHMLTQVEAILAQTA